MDDFERYSDYNEYEDDLPRNKSCVGLVLKILTAVVCLFVVGFLSFRLIIFNRYPDSIKNIYFNDVLTEYYNGTEGNIGAKTQILRAPYDDPDEGNFFCDNLIVIPGANQLQISVRFNVSIIESIKTKYGVELNPDAKENFTFKLSVIPLSKNDETAYPTATITQDPVVEYDKMLMYRYYKLVFDGVDFTLPGEDEIWIRLEIFINGVEMEKPYQILVYEDTAESQTDDYVLSKKERPSK